MTENKKNMNKVDFIFIFVGLIPLVVFTLIVYYWNSVYGGNERI